MKSQHTALGAAAVTAGLILSLTGCGSGAGGDADSLEVWLPTAFASASSNDEKATWEKILAPFEEEHGVELNVTLIPWASYEEKYLTGVSSGEGPAVGYMYTEMMGDYVTNGALVPFDDYLSDDVQDRMLYLPQGQVDGQQYAMPFVVGGMRVLWANMDLLAQAGITELPETWDDFLADSQKLVDAGITPLLQEWGAPDRGMMNSTFFPLLWQAGGDILTEDGSKTAFNSPEGLEAAEYLMTLLDEGYMPDTVLGLSTDEVKAAFLGGETAFMYGSDGTLPELEGTDINAEFVPSLKGEQEGTFVASDALVMLEACPDKQLCTDLVEYILDGDQMAVFHDEIVAYPPIATDEEPDESSAFAQAYQDKADVLHSLPIAAGGAAVYNSLYQNLQQMLLGQKTPEQALQDAADAGDAALAEAQ
ncbi:sugar ABC transporter substrate-binding protein [Microbacterium sp. CIAB417]|uniref:ABC transporter substrate-binding protein n=1 Tax=Microbacterium sp. CIAB417 TaxID=2860287 RepID=UPI001FAD3CE2|nr:sugar ABC transporter substrate-binding protein [Microbacterium sp. CIAB417]